MKNRGNCRASITTSTTLSCCALSFLYVPRTMMRVIPFVCVCVCVCEWWGILYAGNARVIKRYFRARERGNCARSSVAERVLLIELESF